MACCASGSNRGYDELVPHHIHVVDETREYTEWNPNDNKASSRYVGPNSGIIGAKRALNKLHFQLGSEGFSQVFVDQMDTDIVAVTRHCPETHQSVILVAFTAFTHPNQGSEYQRDIKPLRVEGVLEEIVLEASLVHSGSKTGKYDRFSEPKNWKRDEHYVNGLAEYDVTVREKIQLAQSEFVEQTDSGDNHILQLRFKNFKPGCVIAIRVNLQKNVNNCIQKLRELITTFASDSSEGSLISIVGKMSLPDLNRALYRCDEEERDEGKGLGVYNIPNFGPFVYCGLQGFISLLSTVRPSNDLGHPMCGNLREG